MLKILDVLFNSKKKTRDLWSKCFKAQCFKACSLPIKRVWRGWKAGEFCVCESQYFCLLLLHFANIHTHTRRPWTWLELLYTSLWTDERENWEGVRVTTPTHARATTNEASRLASPRTLKKKYEPSLFDSPHPNTVDVITVVFADLHDEGLSRFHENMLCLSLIACIFWRRKGKVVIIIRNLCTSKFKTQTTVACSITLRSIYPHTHISRPKEYLDSRRERRKKSYFSVCFCA